MDSQTQSMSEILFHKEKKQKKNNKTTGQIDKLKKYTTSGELSNGKRDNYGATDKQIKREANFIKNISIDETLQRLTSAGLLHEEYRDWYAKCLHTLGVSFVTAQADMAFNKGKNPQALFHFLLNKAMNKANDPYMPRFNRR